MKPHACLVCGVPFVKKHGNTRFCIKCESARMKVQAAAMGKVHAAIKYGRLPSYLGKLCVDCGAPAQCHDHRDYSRPLDVEPVCWSCNRRRGPAHWQPTSEAA